MSEKQSDFFDRRFHLLERMRERFDFDVPRGMLICKQCGAEEGAFKAELALLHICDKNIAPIVKEACSHDELKVVMDVHVGPKDDGSYDCQVTMTINCANPACAKPFLIKGASVKYSNQSDKSSKM